MNTKKIRISVVVSAFNEEKMLLDCLRSVSWSDEKIVVDNSSSDTTKALAKKHGARVFTRPNHTMLNINKNYGFSKATGDWILNLDADERVDTPLKNEVLHAVSAAAYDAYKIPRRNIIFGKWIRHAGWWPDYQVRLFRKGTGAFAEEHVHEQIRVNGSIGTLNNPIDHENYQSIGQFINKMNHYTENEADQIYKRGYAFSALDAIRYPKEEFFRRYFSQDGFKDGFHGLMLSMAMALYHFVIFLKLWERTNFKTPKENKKDIEKEVFKSYRELLHWLSQLGKSRLSFLRKALIRLEMYIGKIAL